MLPILIVAASSEIVLVLSAGLSKQAPSYSQKNLPEIKVLRLFSRLGSRLRSWVSLLSQTALITKLMAFPAWQEVCLELKKRKTFRLSRFDTAEVCVLILLASCLTAIFLSYFFQTFLAALATFVFLPFAIRWYQASLEKKLQDNISKEMPNIFRSLAMALSSGMTLGQAVEYIAGHDFGRITEEFSAASLKLRSGQSAATALRELAESIRLQGIQLISTALIISQRTGSPLKDLFEQSAKLIERQGEFERLLKVKTAQVRLSVRVVCLLPLILLVALSLMSPDFRLGLATPVGVISILVAFILDFVALLILRHMMREVM